MIDGGCVWMLWRGVSGDLNGVLLPYEFGFVVVLVCILVCVVLVADVLGFIRWCS